MFPVKNWHFFHTLFLVDGHICDPLLFSSARRNSRLWTIWKVCPKSFKLISFQTLFVGKGMGLKECVFEVKMNFQHILVSAQREQKTWNRRYRQSASLSEEVSHNRSNMSPNLIFDFAQSRRKHFASMPSLSMLKKKWARPSISATSLSRLRKSHC